MTSSKNASASQNVQNDFIFPMKIRMMLIMNYISNRKKNLPKCTLKCLKRLRITTIYALLCEFYHFYYFVNFFLFSSGKTIGDNTIKKGTRLKKDGAKASPMEMFTEALSKIKLK